MRIRMDSNSIQHIVGQRLGRKRDISGPTKRDKVAVMKKSKKNERFPDTLQNFDEDNSSYQPEDDVLMEQILENINSTPIGRVLKRISTLPEVRKRKVMNLRQQIHNGEYQLNERLDNALEKVLNDLKI